MCSDVASEEEENDSDFNVGWASKKAPKSKKPTVQQRKQQKPQQRNRTSKQESASRKQTSRTANCVTTNSHVTLRTLQTSPTLVLTKCDVTSRDDVTDCVTSSLVDLKEETEARVEMSCDGETVVEDEVTHNNSLTTCITENTVPLPTTEVEKQATKSSNFSAFLCLHRFSIYKIFEN